VIVLDTHVLIWLLEESPKLGRRAAKTASAALHVDALAVSATTFWEVAHLVTKGRIQIEGSPASFRAVVLELGIREVPVDGDIAIDAASLASTLSDPADCHIVATARKTGARLMTADRRIQDAAAVDTIDANR
jgi:PIN domain nuclease of toxin-antitoxin system